ncbi:MAG: BhlA/UviB family holin-like peptide [Firmicutes bacterium]|nr:BhlA/UviB family holin-like peptide [Bacillota bacterium]
MWDSILNLALSHGLWAALFVGLMIYVLKDSTKREKKYQETIRDLVKSLQIVEGIKKDVEDIKGRVRRVGKNERKIEENFCKT